MAKTKKAKDRVEVDSENSDEQIGHAQSVIFRDDRISAEDAAAIRDKVYEDVERVYCIRLSDAT